MIMGSYMYDYSQIVLHLVQSPLLILLHEKSLQFDWLRAVVFQLNLKYVIFGINTTRDISKLSQITYNNFEISLVVFMPNITTNHAITYTNYNYKLSFVTPF